ncbi:hypothetical protein DFJ58DRAFT_848369 [Suillus subalutaceus]|uniref:uncharacterized protein n=1 Tax=Suillus subalutaceus TaxID=48586 RepID=UPI001B8736CC|nr:uncharacterized protein DFJ58DRAFT_848369 [Suillus subalutaceus]KAG1830932.1 hypothetical protein DFJ58DRAFT_848369 [Suillus subalutaceus]
MAMIVTNYGYFSTAYTQPACQRYYPSWRLSSKAILGIRTFNIARRDRWIGIVLALLYLLSTLAEWFADLFHGIPSVINVRDPMDPHQRARCAPPQSMPTILLKLVVIFPPTHNYKGKSGQDTQRLENVIVTCPTLSAQKKVMTGLPLQFESKSNSKGSKSASDAEFNKPTSAHNSNDMELDIRICVKRSVVDYKDESEHSSSWVK